VPDSQEKWLKILFIYKFGVELGSVSLTRQLYKGSSLESKANLPNFVIDKEHLQALEEPQA
jgi:hypothetical protein